MITNFDIEKNHMYIITIPLIEYLRENGLYKKVEEYDLEDQNLEIQVFCRNSGRGILVQFFFRLVGYEDLEFATALFCTDESEIEAKIFTRLPQLLDVSDLKKLIKRWRKKKYKKWIH